MNIILYNPLSRNGKNKKIVAKIKKKLEKDGHLVETQNILTIKDIKEYIERNKSVNSYIIIGGDGTLNRLVNAIKGYEIKQEIYLYKAGTGNDFIRSLPNKKGLISVKKYLNDLPEVTINDKEILMLNGVGLGLDGLVCHKVNNSKLKKNKMNYFKHALKAFKEYKPIKSKVIIDNNDTIINEKTWFVAVMNSKFFGGGMKIAPKAKRENKEFEIVIIKKIPKWLLLLIFPTIYLGLHVIFKKYVSIYQGNNVSIEFQEEVFMQIDGEDYSNVNKIIAIKK